MITIRSSKDVSEPTLIGFEAILTTAFGVYEFSSNGPILDPAPFSGGLFGRIAWPRSRFKISPGITIEQQMFVSDGASDIAISWELKGSSTPVQLAARPYFAACGPRGYRDVGFYFESEHEGGRLAWLPDVRGPKIIADTNGCYVDEPLSLSERVKLRDDEQLLAPGRFEFQLSQHPSVLIFSTDGNSKTRHQQQIGAFLAGLLQTESREKHKSEKLELETGAQAMAA
jgi:hypothetical protein